MARLRPSFQKSSSSSSINYLGKNRTNTVEHGFCWKDKIHPLQILFQSVTFRAAHRVSTSPQEKNVTQARLGSGTPAMQSSRQCPICNEWNYNPSPRCPSPRCRYRHICMPCSRNPSIVDKAHKIIQCKPPPTQPSQVCYNLSLSRDPIILRAVEWASTLSTILNKPLL